ncbi:hypothetical protein ACFS27_07050 [Promicromonospora vindobonensis]|uniref:Uncharacterized protein n=1 Tax=Promicromonospora vindobonensis TaxID=195748 RepID=A0ABW5VNM9_9MICO
MSPLVAGALALATDPSPNPTEGTLRPGLEEWQVSPGLIGFVVTFALALACVALFLNLSKHLRRAGHNAREQGLPVPEPEVITFRRAENDTAPGSEASGTSDASTSPSDTGSSSSSSGGSGD